MHGSEFRQQGKRVTEGDEQCFFEVEKCSSVDLIDVMFEGEVAV